LGDFFDKHVRDVAKLPYDEAFGYVGLRLVRVKANEPYDAGISLEVEDPRTVVIGNVRNNSPAEEAGLQRGDVIITLAGRPVNRQAWPSPLARYKEGSHVPITVKRDRQTIQAVLVLGAPERFDYRIEENPGATQEQKSLRAAWLK
jgi:predicted metalloprotease with PDZ domain